MVSYGANPNWRSNRPAFRNQPPLSLASHTKTPVPGSPVGCPAVDPAQSPSVWVAQNLGFTPDPRQAEFLDLDDPRIVYLTSRQSGKTQTAGAKAVHCAFAFPGSEFLLFGAVSRQSSNLLGRIRGFLHHLGVPCRRHPDHPQSILLPNGSSFIALPGIPKNIRSFAAIRAILIDEAAFVEDDLYPAVTPMVAISKGSLWVLSTPWGQNNVFYQLCNTLKNGWTVVRSPAAECPRISPEFLAAERLLHGEKLYAQEYECAFVSAAHQFLDRAVIAQALLPHQPLPIPCVGLNELFVGIDVGKRQDHTAIVALEFSLSQAETRDPVTYAARTQPQLLVRHAESLPLGSDHLDLPARLRSVIASLPGPFKAIHLIIDATGESTLIEVLRRDRWLAAYPLRPVAITGGYHTSQLSGGYQGIPRPDLLTRLRTAFHTGRLSLPEAPGLAELESELVAFRTDGHQSTHDDLVFALALAVWLAYEQQKDHLLPAPRLR
jgi:hypothetical protein